MILRKARILACAALLLNTATLTATATTAASVSASAATSDPIAAFDAAVARGDAAAALEAGRAAAAWRRARLAARPAELATELHALAFRLYQESGAGADGEAAGEALFKEALDLRRQAFGPDHLEVAASLDTLSTVHYFQGRFDDAETEERQALAMLERLLPAGDMKIAKARDGLGTILYKEGRYAEAEPLLNAALEAFRAASPPDPERVGASLNVLGELARSRDDFAAAEARFRLGLDLVREPVISAATGLDTLRGERARLRNNLAGLYKDEGRYAESEDLLRQSLAEREAAPPTDPQVDLATARLNLAEVARLQGLLDEAERGYVRALELARPALGTDNPSLAWFLNQTAVLYRDQGRFDAAERMERETVDLLRRTLGDGHFQTAQALHDLGRLLLQRGRAVDAQAPLREALAIRQKVYGDAHPEVALTRIELARAADPTGADAGAVAKGAMEEIDQAITILAGGVAYPEALAEAHAVRADLLRRGAGAGSGSTASRAGAIAELQAMARLVDAMRPGAGGGEAARAGFLAKYAVWSDQLVLDLLHDGRIDEAFAAAESARSRALLDQLSLGRVDLLAGVPEEQRRPLAGREQSAGARLAELQERVTVMRGRSDLQGEERARRVAALEKDLVAAAADYTDARRQIQGASRLWRRAGGAVPVALAAAQQVAVPPGGLLLLYVVGAEESALLVVPPAPQAATVHPLVVNAASATILGLPAGPLRDADLRRVLSGDAAARPPSRGVMALLTAPPRRGPFADEEGAAATLASRLNALWQVLVPRTAWGQVKKAEEVVLLPDGALHGLAFEALVVKPGATMARTRFWLDDGPPIRYAPSATLLREIAALPPPHGRQVLTVSDPIYDQAAAPDAALRGQFARAGGALARLPGTARESQAIVEAFADPARVTVLQGAKADEAGVRAALLPNGGAPRNAFIHIAAHGLIDAQLGDLFAALALTPPAVPTGRHEEDGFLQLFEIYDLDLTCEMAVLSACGTETGRQVAGEGVFALSRGFLAAGARRVVASQWSVDDASTAVLVGDLFRRIAARETEGPRYAAALRDAKRSVRARPDWSAPFYWAPFVLTGTH